MNFEHVDLQWTAICNSSPKKMFSSVVARATALGWSFNDIVVKGSDDALFGVTEKWPPETFGSATYTSRGEKHNLFWSTYYDGKFCKITGGLYIKQYLLDGESLEQGARHVLDDLWELFDGDDNLCVVLCLEDDDGIDVAPGVIGRYREALWKVVQSSFLQGILTTSKDEWVEVQPESSQDSELRSIFSMNDNTLKSILYIQSVLDAELWKRRKGPGPRKDPDRGSLLRPAEVALIRPPSRPRKRR
jgi:hypothetical protein